MADHKELSDPIFFLADEIALAAARGLPVVITVDRPLEAASARLMASLGVEVIVDARAGRFVPPSPTEPVRRHCHPACQRTHGLCGKCSPVRVDAQTLTRSHDCVQPGCPEVALFGLEHCRRHAPIDQLRGQREQTEDNGLTALHAMDAGEPQPVAPKRKGMAPKWTPEKIIAAIQRWAREHGKPPTSIAWIRSGDYWPTFSTAAAVFGTWGKAIEAAGFPRPTSGGNQKPPKVSVGEPLGPEEPEPIPPAAPPAEAPAEPPAVTDSPRPDTPEPGPPTENEITHISHPEIREPELAEAPPVLTFTSWEEIVASLDHLKAEERRLDEIAVSAEIKRDAVRQIIEAIEQAA